MAQIKIVNKYSNIGIKYKRKINKKKYNGKLDYFNTTITTTVEVPLYDPISSSK